MAPDRLGQGERLILLLKEIMKGVGRRMLKPSRHDDLTLPQLLVVRTLVRHGPLSLTRLGREVSLAKSTVSGIVDRLERAGYVRRKADPTDRRKTRVELTEKYNRLKWKVPDDFSGYVGDLLATFDESETAAAFRFLERFSRLIRERQGEE
ncbi:MAG TPA: MarR family transcriptional regulator [Bacillota bacterium]|jgi:DNA-binding MarR family transcriptional regulator